MYRSQKHLRKSLVKKPTCTLKWTYKESTGNAYKDYLIFKQIEFNNNRGMEYVVQENQIIC